MTEIALPPPPRHQSARAIIVEIADVAGENLHGVTMWQGRGRPAKRRWFASRALALAHAADRADEHGLILVDMAGDEEPGA